MAMMAGTTQRPGTHSNSRPGPHSAEKSMYAKIVYSDCGFILCFLATIISRFPRQPCCITYAVIRGSHCQWFEMHWCSCDCSHMSINASQITGNLTVCSTACSLSTTFLVQWYLKTATCLQIQVVQGQNQIGFDKWITFNVKPWLVQLTTKKTLKLHTIGQCTKGQ